MFFRSRSQEPAGENPRLADDSDAGTDEAVRGQAQRLAVWRQSTQQVARAWDAWLAAESRDHAMRYRAFVTALAGEESAAAELERMINPAKTGRCVNTSDTQTSRQGAP